MSGAKSYFDWLHEFTLLGYEERVFVQKEDKDEIDGYFNDNKSPEEAYKIYKSKNGRSNDDRMDQ